MLEAVWAKRRMPEDRRVAAGEGLVDLEVERDAYCEKMSVILVCRSSMERETVAELPLLYWNVRAKDSWKRMRSSLQGKRWEVVSHSEHS